MKLTLEFLRVIVLDWAMSPDMLWRFRSPKYRGMVLNTDTGYVWHEIDQREWELS